MPKALWNGQVIAETETFEEVDGNVYFPPDSLEREFLQESDHTTVCGWKGTANYYTVVVDGNKNENAGFYYADPKPKAANLKGHVAFWKGVEIQR